MIGGASALTPAGRPRSGGAVATPPELAARLAERLGTRPLVLDPACGEGALLLAALARAGGGAAAARSLHGIELDAARLARARARLAAASGLGLPALARRLRQGDALAPGARWPRRTWILANPPWLSFSGRQAAGGPAPGGPGSPGGWPSSHGAFLVAIARHVARERTGAEVLLPASVLELAGYAPVRRAVAGLARLTASEELGARAFPGVLGAAVLVGLRPLEAPIEERALPEDRPLAALLAALERLPRPPPGTFRDPGVHTGNAAQLLVLGPQARGWPGLRQGRDLAPFRLGAPSARLCTDLAPAPGRRFRIAPLARYGSFPVLLRQTARRPLAALHEPAGYFRNSLLAAGPIPGIDPACLVALLNGPVAGLWHHLRFRDARQRSFPQVKVAHLATTPLPLRGREDAPRLHDELAARARGLARASDARERRRLELRALDAFPLARDQKALVLALAAERALLLADPPSRAR